MTLDVRLERRVRDLVSGEPALSERRMFGGVAFLVGGRMAVAASGEGGLLVRVDPALTDSLLETTAARPAAMHGRELRGWLRVDAEAVPTEAALARWVELGTGYARSLPGT